MSLPEPLQRIADRVCGFYERGGDAPYQIYVYEPGDEWKVRGELRDLQLWLEAPGREIHCAAISLADVFWKALRDGGWLESLEEAERDAADDPEGYRSVVHGVTAALGSDPSLPDRVVAELDRIDEEQGADARIAVFLYRAGALYPAYRTSTILDDLLGRVRRPVTLLYPGSIVGEHGLRFMGVCEPAYGYRALKIPRGR